MTAFIADIMAVLRHHWRSMLVFHVFFTGILVAMVTPAITWILSGVEPVTGNAAITTGGLIEFLLSPGGLLWMVISTAMTILIIILQQAGIVRIAATEGAREYAAAIGAVWALIRKLGIMARLALIQVSAHIGMTVPFALVIAFAYQRLISPFDVNLLWPEMPPAMWIFIASTAPILIAAIVVNAWLYGRWILAIPLVMIEHCGARTALRRSSALTRDRRRYHAMISLSALGVMLFLPIIFTILFASIGGFVLSWISQRIEVLIPVTIAYLILYIMLSIIVAVVATATHGAFIYSLYLEVAGHGRWKNASMTPRHTGRLAWSAEIIVIVLSVYYAVSVLGSFEHRDDVMITAHRGSSYKAPENTLSAIEQAIEDGADYVEVDVRMTSDGHLVLWHDRTLNRLAGIDQLLAHTPLEETRKIDAGGWFDEKFSGERIPTLEEAIGITRGRVDLYIDIKSSSLTPDLPEALVSILRKQDAVDGTIIASMNRKILDEIRDLEPSVSRALLAQFIVGPIHLDHLDALALRENHVTPTQVARAHRAGIEMHVWTVNDRATMADVLDMGVDNIITDRPDRLKQLLDDRAMLSEGERLVVKIHNWLSNPARGFALQSVEPAG